MEQKPINFDFFLGKFPELELPITIAEQTHIDFSRNNEPLNPLMIQQFLVPLEDKPIDEYSEFIACFRIPQTIEFQAIVYWRAGLMDYQYNLVTFTKKGILIDKRVIAGTFSDGEMLTRSVATIDEDWVISVVSGQVASSETTYDASTSRIYKLELLPDGKIVNLL